MNPIIIIKQTAGVTYPYQEYASRILPNACLIAEVTGKLSKQVPLPMEKHSRTILLKNRDKDPSLAIPNIFKTFCIQK